MTSPSGIAQTGWNFAVLAFAVLSSVFGAATPAFAEDANLTLALRDYEKGYFRSAVRNLELVCIRDPHNGHAHYYLANCYLHLSEKALAAEEYKLALNYCHDPKTVEYCRKAVLTLTVGSQSAQTVPIHPPGKTRYLAGTSTSIPLPASYDHGVNAQALKRIEKQANSFSRDLEHQKERITRNAEDSYKNDAEKIRQEGAMEERRMATTTYVRTVTTGGSLKRYEFPVYSQEEIAARKAVYEYEAKRREDLGKQHTDVIQSSMTKRQSGLAESADNLRTQLSKTPSLSDSTSLEPLGTNLFVRNYQPISRILDGLPPVKPVSAKAESIRPDTANADSSTNPQSATGRLGPASASSTKAPAQVETKVKGELLK